MLQEQYEAVLRYALSLTKDEDTASELTQETFLKAVNGFGKFSGRSSLLTWLCSIARNTWLNDIKRAKKIQPLPEEQDHPDWGKESFEEALVRKDTAMKIHEILHELDEPYKEVFTLRVFGELEFKDISAIFNKSESWGRVTFFRAKQLITGKLAEKGVTL
ncbi:MAG: RNA polymerase sigma factor [Parasporobacterium sp.]|nr:RNA polymerase sigma factor [Parasporobacterium sp.]